MNGEFITTADRRWQAYLAEVPHDVYHLPEYVAFAARHEGGTPAAFWAEEGGQRLLIPLLLRDLPAGLGAPQGWRDAASPYGYPAPLLDPDADERQVERLLQAFVCGCRAAGIVTVFLRFHPLLASRLAAFGRYGDLVRHGRTVCIDLRVAREQLWRNTRENHRRGIAALLEEGFSARFDRPDDWSSFSAVYAATMQRVQAAPFYHFPAAYFRDLQDALGAQLHLCAVLSPSGDVAAAGLFTVVDELVQYHLGGTAERYLERAPSKLMFNAVRDWAQDAGCRLFHLGGGVGGRDDSLFRFKAGFSAGTAEFHTCRLVVQHERYAWLNERFYRYRAIEKPFDEGYFPLYRS